MDCRNMKKRILVVYPNNLFQSKTGTNTRVTELAKCFCELGYSLDLFAFNNFNADSDFDTFYQDNNESLIERLFLYDYDKSIKKLGIFKWFTRKLKRFMENIIDKKTYLANWIQPECQHFFDEIISENEYYAIVFFYTYMTTLLDGKDISAKKYIFLEDCFFLQQHMRNGSKKKNETLGRLLDEEINRLNVFDEIFCISYDEKIMYEKFLGREIHFMPHTIKETDQNIPIPVYKRKWDICYIGSDNPYNVEGLTWFLNEVLPFLDDRIRMVFVGKMNASADIPQRENIDIISFAKSLDLVYNDSKICICPMFHGTGMKIKVVEAMSHGLPMVCNERGVDGFPDKTLAGCLVTQKPDEFADYISRLIEDEGFYSDISDRVKEYYTSVFDRGKILNTMKDIMEK